MIIFQNMYYFYILLSEKDDKYYYGSTINLRRRAKDHAEGKVTATRHRRPIRLIYYEAYEDLVNARLREKQVKASGSIRSALNRRINSNLQDELGQPGRLQDSRASSSAG